MKSPDLTGKRLLLIKPSSLGDIVHAVPTAWALKARWPGLHLTWLVNRGFEDLIKPMQAIDETIPFDRGKFRGLLAPITKRTELKSFAATLREARFDAVLDMQGLFRSGVFSWLSRAGLRVGERSAREAAWLFYNQRIETPEQPVHARERYAALARALGCETPERQDLDVSEVEREASRRKLADVGFGGGPLIAVCPTARWDTKIYPAKSFARVLDTLADEGRATQPVIVGGPETVEAGKEILASCQQARPINLAGQTDLRELAAVCELADLMVTCDSGPMHIAAAQGTPVVAVFGPTDPIRTGPFGQQENVIRGHCPLMPCLKRECPGMGLICMRELQPEVVAEKALALLLQTADNVRT